MNTQTKTLEMWQQIVDFLNQSQPEMPEELRDATAWAVAKHFAENPGSTVLDRMIAGE